MIASELELEYIHVMRGWHVLESDVLTSGFDIVDFDLAPEQGQRNYENRSQVYNDLVNLLDKATRVKQPLALLEKIRASKMFAEALVKGIKDIEEYLEDTQKVGTTLIPDHIIKDYKLSCFSLLSDAGFTFNKAGLDSFMEEYLIQDQKEIHSTIMEDWEFWQKAIREKINFYDEIRVKVTFVSKDEPWQIGLSGNIEVGTIVEVNTHKRHHFTKGQCRYLASHEIAGHALQFAARERKIAEGKLGSYSGIISTFNPDIAVSEGLAQNVPYFVAEETTFEPTFRVAKRLRELRDMLIHNAYLMAEAGVNIDECIDYCVSNSPFLTVDEVRTNLIERLENVLLKSYMACYAPWFLLFRQYISRMKNKDRLIDNLLRQLYLEFPPVEKIRRTLA